MIPVFTLERQNKFIGNKISQIIKKVIVRGKFILGDEVAKFEQEFANYLGVNFAVGVASGTDALTLALLSCGISAGDEVIIPANSYPTVFGVIASGAKPVLVDINAKTFNLDPLLLEKRITTKTRAVIPVHLYGYPAEMEKITSIARKYKILVIEDCAQAHGASLNIKDGWKKVGTVGDVGCFSFYPSKNLGCFGDGGIIVTQKPDIYKKVKLYRMYGEEKRYESILLGRNSRLDELQAAILNIKLQYLNKWNRQRRKIAQLYKALLAPLNNKGVILPLEDKNAQHVYHLYVIRAQKRDKLRKFLKDEGIQTSVHYLTPIHCQPSMKYLGYSEGDFPVTEETSRSILSLPCFPELNKREVNYIGSKIFEFYDKKV